jgi:hypothetical protein
MEVRTHALLTGPNTMRCGERAQQRLVPLAIPTCPRGRRVQGDGGQLAPTVQDGSIELVRPPARIGSDASVSLRQFFRCRRKTCCRRRCVVTDEDDPLAEADALRDSRDESSATNGKFSPTGNGNWPCQRPIMEAVTAVLSATRRILIWRLEPASVTAQFVPRRVIGARSSSPMHLGFLPAKVHSTTTSLAQRVSTGCSVAIAEYSYLIVAISRKSAAIMYLFAFQRSTTQAMKS